MNKRFSVVCCVTDWYIEDKLISPFAVLTPHQASDLLNEQHETIERLKQNITELLSVNVEEDLLKENEELKQRIDNICREINDKPTMTTTEVMVKLQELIF